MASEAGGCCQLFSLTTSSLFAKIKGAVVGWLCQQFRKEAWSHASRETLISTSWDLANFWLYKPFFIQNVALPLRPFFAVCQFLSPPRPCPTLVFGWLRPYMYTYVRCTYGILSREPSFYTVIYNVRIQFWPTLHFFVVIFRNVLPNLDFLALHSCLHTA
jgi:hypothetical protein